MKRGPSASRPSRASGGPRKSGIPTKVRSSSSERDCTSRLTFTGGLRRSKSQLSLTPCSGGLQTPASWAASGPHPGSTGKQSLASGRKTPKALRQPTRDTRSLQDKDYQQKEIKMIMEYFTATEDYLSLCPKGLNLRQMLLKTFVDMVNHLIHKLDPDYLDITLANYVEEIPFVMKMYRYPATVNASWLKTANTQHSLPHVLGLLSWLVTIVRNVRPIQLYNEDDEEVKEEIKRNSCDPNTAFPFGTAKMYVDYAIRQFEKWNSYQDCTDADNDNFINSLGEMQGLTNAHMAHFESEVQVLRNQINDPKELAGDNRRKEMEESVKMIKSELAQTEGFVAKAEEYLRTVENQLDAARHEYKILEKERDDELKNIECLRAQLSKQIMTPQERDALMSCSEELSNDARAKEELIASLTDEIYRNDAIVAQLREKMRQKVQALNLKLDTESEFVPELENLGLSINLLRPEALKKVAHITEIIQSVVQKLKAVKELHLQELKEAKALSKKLSDTIVVQRQELSRLQDANFKSEQDLKKTRRRFAEEEEELMRNEKKIRAEIEILLSANSAEELKKELKTLIENKMRVEKFIDELKEKADKFFKKNTDLFKQVVTEVADHKREVMKRVQSSLEKNKAKVEKSQKPE